MTAGRNNVEGIKTEARNNMMIKNRKGDTKRKRSLKEKMVKERLEMKLLKKKIRK